VPVPLGCPSRSTTSRRLSRISRCRAISRWHSLAALSLAVGVLGRIQDDRAAGAGRRLRLTRAAQDNTLTLATDTRRVTTSALACPASLLRGSPRCVSCRLPGWAEHLPPRQCGIGVWKLQAYLDCGLAALLFCDISSSCSSYCTCTISVRAIPPRKSLPKGEVRHNPEPQNRSSDIPFPFRALSFHALPLGIISSVREAGWHAFFPRRARDYCQVLTSNVLGARHAALPSQPDLDGPGCPVPAAANVLATIGGCVCGTNKSLYCTVLLAASHHWTSTARRAQGDLHGVRRPGSPSSLPRPPPGPLGTNV
jgi:hypothetical protein